MRKQFRGPRSSTLSQSIFHSCNIKQIKTVHMWKMSKQAASLEPTALKNFFFICLAYQTVQSNSRFLKESTDLRERKLLKLIGVLILIEGV